MGEIWRRGRVGVGVASAGGVSPCKFTVFFSSPRPTRTPPKHKHAARTRKFASLNTRTRLAHESPPRMRWVLEWVKRKWAALRTLLADLDLCNMAFVAPTSHVVRRTRSGRYKRVD